tara:strand:+ start:210 stop:1145 length:936 start_codon:yes stop_codon:yes gene_type:complete
VSCSNNQEDPSITTSIIDCEINMVNTFEINLNPQECNIDLALELGIESLYSESIADDYINISTNSIPNHNVGLFPNPGNPNTISAINKEFLLTVEPNIEESITSAQGYMFGILFTGVSIDPFTAEFFEQSNGQKNRNWNITTLTNSVNLGLDCNNAHVQPNGKYHYHGTPSSLIEILDTGGDEMIRVGYAADGFPIYYKYISIDDQIIEAQSGYLLKSGQRNGDGLTAPNGCHDGTYFQDYEYVEGISPLDQCNGIYGKTLKNENEYFYVITDNFPSSPICFMGSPDESFKNSPLGSPNRIGVHNHHIINN